jgi:CheY-like chemotaxis protein
MAKIMIVEDERDLRETYSDILEGEGHTVVGTGSSADAIQQLGRFIPDVVLLDLQMPGGSGLLVLSFIRRLPRLRTTKVIIVSGHEEMKDQAIKEWGADLFLSKPISAATLKSTVSNLNTHSVK